jgi:hypothetical protein
LETSWTPLSEGWPPLTGRRKAKRKSDRRAKKERQRKGPASPPTASKRPGAPRGM